MKDEIPRKTVMILVVVALIISLLSTTLVLNAVYNADTPTFQPEQMGPPSGKAVFHVPGMSYSSVTSAKTTLTVKEP